jgi:hypothetical protein
VLNFASQIIAALALLGSDAGSLSPAAPAPPLTAAPVEQAAAAPPPGGDGREQARSAAQAALIDGNHRLTAGDVQGALAEYRRAQSLFPEAAAKVEFNIGKAELSRGGEPEAAAAFERFLALSPRSPAEFRAEASQAMARLTAALAAVRVAPGRPGVLVRIDGQERGTTPIERTLWLRPGRHAVTMEEAGRVVHEREIDALAGAAMELTVAAPPPVVASSDLSASLRIESPAPLLGLGAGGSGAGERDHAPPADAPASERPLWKRWWVWAAAAAVVAGTAAVIWTVQSGGDDCPSGFVCRSQPE